MRGVNRVILVATCGKDPDVRYGQQSGSAIATVSVATNESWKDKNGEKQERTEWHRLKFFGRLAEIAGEYLKKGSQVYVEGSLRTEKYTDKQGIDRYSTDIIVNEMQMLGGRPNGDGAQRNDHGADRDHGDNYGASRNSSSNSHQQNTRPQGSARQPASHREPAAASVGGDGGADEFDDIPFAR